MRQHAAWLIDRVDIRKRQIKKIMLETRQLHITKRLINSKKEEAIWPRFLCWADIHLKR